LVCYYKAKLEDYPHWQNPGKKGLCPCRGKKGYYALDSHCPARAKEKGTG